MFLISHSLKIIVLWKRHFANLMNCDPAQGLHPEKRRTCRVFRSSRVRNGWKPRTTLKDPTITPSWPCTSCHPSGGGVHACISSEGSWPLHTPAVSLQSSQTSMFLFLGGFILSFSTFVYKMYWKSLLHSNILLFWLCLPKHSCV